jgi:HJR/Mrr/RecB family endonuclease
MISVAGATSPLFRQVLMLITMGVCGLIVLVLLVWIPLQFYRHRHSGTAHAPPTTTLHFQAPAPASASRPMTPVEFVAELRNVDWFQFEKVIEAIYLKSGDQVERRGGANPDGGVDLVLRRAGERIAVQCKQWKTWNVGVKPVREFLGAMTHGGFTSGIFVTLRGYTADAKALAAGHNIEILSETDLITLLLRSKALSDPAVMRVLKDRTKYCPKCEAEMVIRRTKRGINIGRKFWGCSTFPQCKYIMSA